MWTVTFLFCWTSQSTSVVVMVSLFFFFFFFTLTDLSLTLETDKFLTLLLFSPSSRSRSQSRSRSASYGCDRNYGKEYQNNRGFRGYSRGYRRPYYYRGRGFFPRGRYQRGVGGYGCGAYRRNSWQDYQGRQQPAGEKEFCSPRRAHSRSRTPKKRSGSQHSRSQSHHSNHSSSGLSPHSLSSSSHYSSPKYCGKGKKERKSKGKRMSRTSCVHSPQLRSAVVIGQGVPASPHVGLSPSAAMGSSAAPWKSISPMVPGKSPPEAAPAGTFSGFGFFSKDSLKAREKSTISPAFHKFLVEHQKKEGPEWVRSLNPFDGDREQGAAKPTDLTRSGRKAEKEPGRKEHKQLCSPPQGMKEPGEQKGNTPPIVGRLMAETLGRWEPSNPAAVDIPSPDDEAGGNLEKEVHYSRKQERTTPATSRERAVVGKDSFPEWLPRGSRKEKPVDSPPRGRPPVWNWKEEAFRHEGSPFCANTVAKERRLCQELVHHKPKEQEFRSIFQHIKAAQFWRSPSEVFTQHVVAIVHHVKARHFSPSELTLHDRFSLYLRQAVESDMKVWKSPKIHRRINVSPSIFKRHSQVFEETRSYKDVNYKATQVKHLKLEEKLRDVLKLSCRRHVALLLFCLSRKSKKQRSQSSSCSAEHHLRDSTSGVETFSKVHVALHDHDAVESSQDHRGFVSLLCVMAAGSFTKLSGPLWLSFCAYQDVSFGMKSRGWSMGSYSRNHTDNEPPDTVVGKCPPAVEWDSEYIPKSKKYHLCDDGVMDEEWLEHGPHGQGQFTQVPNSFLYHKSNGNPKWAPDNLQVTMEEGELQEDGELEPPEGGIVAPKH
uniref:Thyroid hormone receptor associated protein 3b n=1 Tax=Scleropages formosus TaxID=113540 RepID=A0A8C9QTA9_SCLFO